MKEMFWKRDDLVTKYTLTHDFGALDSIRKERESWLARECWKPVRHQFEKLPQLADPHQVQMDASGATVAVSGPVDAEGQRVIDQTVEVLHPWRKGPFQLFGTEIDAEWRSDFKWERIRPALGELQDKRILDVGCGNGYYMFRASAHRPRLVYGIDPSVAFKFQFELMQKYARCPELQYDLLGVEHIGLFSKTFDLTLCMGIVYHHRGPIEILQNLKSTLRVGGKCLVESLSIPGDESIALFPQQRFAKARNVYFVPTASCLVHWMERAGFKDVQLVAHTPIERSEQRRTPFMRFESLEDFLDPNDSSKTVEGYPAPWRTAVIGTRSQ